jgi:glycosyltransferase involved in cell wall biosynthesis
MKKNKILFVTPYFYPHPGGLENYVYNIARKLSEKYNWNVVVVTSGSTNEKQIETVNNIKIYRLPVLFKISNTPINPLWYFQIKKIIEREDPDIVDAHSPVPFISDITALAVGDIPFILTYHSGTMKKNIFLSDILIWIYEKLIFKYILNKSMRLIVPSDFVKRTILRGHANKSVIISPGVNINVFKPITKKENSENTVLFICRFKNMHRMKGFGYLLKAMEQLPFAKLKIIGEKGETSGKNVEYLGPKTGKDLVREIQNSSLLVLPSLAHMESFGMVLIEAMACRVPVIGTNIGGIPEVINNGIDGLIISPKNSTELEKAIRKILTNKQLATSMGEAGYRKVNSKYTWDLRSKLTNDLFVSCLK